MILDRITQNSTIMNGQPCVRGMRLTVRRVLEILATYPDREQSSGNFPNSKMKICVSVWNMLQVEWKIK